MHLKYSLTLLSFLFLSFANAQSFLAKVIDQETQEPIPYATIETGLHQGMVSNEEGEFTFLLENIIPTPDSIYISYMGYETKGIVFEENDGITIPLIPKLYELKEVFLTTEVLTIKEIIKKVKDSLDKNYAFNLTKKKIFFRQSEINNIKKMDFGFKKSTIDELNKELLDSITKLLPKKSSYYREVVADLYGDYNNYKLNINKAAELYDKNNDISLSGIEKKLEVIFNENIKKDSYLKIKSGFFSTKKQVDSILQENEEAKATLEKKKKEGTLEFQEQISNQIANLYEQLFLQEGSIIDVLDNSGRYNFTLDNYTVINEMAVYILQFTPKGGKDFKGTMYVNTQDFAIVRLDFENVKPLNNFALLGITYRNNIYKGKMLFDKDENGSYSPRFLELLDGSYMGFDRPVKVIEKNKNVRGRRKQNELFLKLHIQGNQLQKQELVVFESENITQSSFDLVEGKQIIKATYLSKYDPMFWKDYSIMEPNEAIESFKVVE
ncbi:MAG: carboxypeptidase-like regulatory domain-containing protein [Flavobacteriaceae bacterium]|nr:carboxypeptidase-like regulatory domain-containing protein [Flavobacteriaceae bacterium]